MSTTIYCSQLLDTLEGVEDCEYVVGGDPEGSVGCKGKTPRDTQNATQAHDGQDAFAILAHLSIRLGSLETKEPGHDDNEGGEGEEENHQIVADVDNVKDVTVCYPAPWNRKTSQFL